MTVRFERDPEFENAILREPLLGAHLKERVDAAASRASDLAPDDPSTGPPDLHSSVFGDVELTARGFRGHVGAEDYKARWFEEGATGVPARPFLRPAVEQEVGPLGVSDELGGLL